MDEDLERFLQFILRATDLEEVQGDLIPLPPGQAITGNALFVNGVLPEGIAHRGEPARLLEACRANAGTVMLGAREYLNRLEFSSFCFSIYGVSQEGSNVRLYRVAIGRELLIELPADDVMKGIEGEDSQHREIRQLLGWGTRGYDG
jgi:hypothetical protein